MADWMSAHLRTTEWSLMPSSSSMKASVNPFLASAEADFPLESFTLATSSHCTMAKAMPTTAQIGMKISVPRSGSRVASPIAFALAKLAEERNWRKMWGKGWAVMIKCMQGFGFLFSLTCVCCECVGFGGIFGWQNMGGWWKENFWGIIFHCFSLLETSLYIYIDIFVLQCVFGYL